MFEETAAPLDHVGEIADVLGGFALGDTGELRFFGGASNFNLSQNSFLNDSSAMGARMRGIEVVPHLPGSFEIPMSFETIFLAFTGGGRTVGSTWYPKNPFCTIFTWITQVDSAHLFC